MVWNALCSLIMWWLSVVITPFCRFQKWVRFRDTSRGGHHFWIFFFAVAHDARDPLVKPASLSSPNFVSCHDGVILWSNWPAFLLLPLIEFVVEGAVRRTWEREFGGGAGIRTQRLRLVRSSSYCIQLFLVFGSVMHLLQESNPFMSLESCIAHWCWFFEKNKQFDHVCDCQLKTGILKDIALSRWCRGHATSLLTEKSAKCVELKEELNVPSQDGTLKCVM